MRWPRTLPAALVIAVTAAGVAACKRAGSASGDAGVDGGARAEGSANAPSVTPVAAAAAAEPPSDKPLLGVIAFVTTVYKEPRDTSKKLGYLRLGSKVVRSAEPAGKSGCPGGWYQIEPRGYVCVGDEATIDLDTPILKAARLPNLKTALPFKYAFVRAVLPMYLRVPSAEEQYKSEFQLKEHLEKVREKQDDFYKVILGANDIPLDDRGVPMPDKKIGELGLGKNSLELSVGQLLGGETDEDPLPFWLEGGKRLIPNISDYKTKGFELFADRARRHTGLSVVGSFPTGPESLNRRFSVTTDLRLVPATKIKPDTGSPWHGVELTGGLTLPLAFIRSQSARTYRISKGRVSSGDAIEYRDVYGLVGKMRTVDGVRYYRTIDKRWLRSDDVGLAVEPSSWPADAEKGKKWIEISITNQTFVMWEGRKPVYATLVSTGQAGLDDPKKSTATIRGSFRIRNKHISAVMDSNESSSVGGRANTTASRTILAVSTSDDHPSKKKRKGSSKDKSSSKDKKGDKGKKGAKHEGHDKPIPRRGDGVYGVTKRRGEGTFLLRDVPYIQYFESGYALHAAYWHDVFGTPRSHGCVNLAPVDAHRVFFWTEPQVPPGWHGVNTTEETGEGTLVVIHE